MLLTRPEPDHVLEAFYRKVRPGGPGWRRQREASGVEPAQRLGVDIARTAAGGVALFGLMFGVGGLLLLRPAVGIANLAAAAAAFAVLAWLRGRGREVVPEPADA
jgi:hypothetical protein